MNTKHFDSLKQASADFVKTVDALVPDYEKGTEADVMYNDDLQAERRKSRNADTERAINTAAATAKAKAEAEIKAMRVAFTNYLGRLDNPAALKVAQGLVSAGGPTQAEAIMLADTTTDYCTLRILAPYAKGHITLPDPTALDTDLKEIRTYFDMLPAYSGPGNQLAAAISARPFGLSPHVSGTIIRGQIQNFSAKLDEICSRWENVKED